MTTDRQGTSSETETVMCYDSMCQESSPIVAHGGSLRDARPSSLASTPSSVIDAFRHCLFCGNEATGSGGAVYVKQYFDGDFQLFNCTFERNEAGQYGGGVFLAAAGTEALLVEATFVDK